jgi:hypothetical protein
MGLGFEILMCRSGLEASETKQKKNGIISRISAFVHDFPICYHRYWIKPALHWTEHSSMCTLNTKRKHKSLLFICESLPTLLVASNGRTRDELKGFVRKRLWFNWGTILLFNRKDRRKTWKKNLSHDSRCLERDSNRAPAEYKSQTLPLYKPAR